MPDQITTKSYVCNRGKGWFPAFKGDAFCGLLDYNALRDIGS
jgi:hypothetical protein